MSLSKAHLLPKSTCNTKEAVAPSQHDLIFFYRDVKNQSINQPTNSIYNTTSIKIPLYGFSFLYNFPIFHYNHLKKINKENAHTFMLIVFIFGLNASDSKAFNYAKQSLLQDIQLPNASLSLNSQGMSAEKQVPQTTNINSVGELTCTDFQGLLTPTDH